MIKVTVEVAPNKKHQSLVVMSRTQMITTTAYILDENLKDPENYMQKKKKKIVKKEKELIRGMMMSPYCSPSFSIITRTRIKWSNAFITDDSLINHK